MTSKEEKQLRKLAKKRVEFKRNLNWYVFVNLFLIFIWFRGEGWSLRDFNFGDFWPAWVLLGWGISLFFNYRSAYEDPRLDTEREYERLKNEMGER
jgi:hypothetical protein